MNAARKKLGTNDLRGKVFVSSGNINYRLFYFFCTEFYD